MIDHCATYIQTRDVLNNNSMIQKDLIIQEKIRRVRSQHYHPILEKWRYFAPKGYQNKIPWIYLLSYDYLI